MSKYNPNDNYCTDACQSQSVPSTENVKNLHPDWSADKINEQRTGTPYSCPDNYQMGSIQDNQIYIATTDGQHVQVARGEHVDAHGGLSGYFSDQATVDACKNGEALDNTKYNEMCQIAPYRNGGIDGEAPATYKPHVDCFDIDKDALYKNYGTNDFNAAISKCEANNQFGGGGGNQGYNPYISEMIDNGTLKYNPDKSYSDSSLSKSEYSNPNNLTNSTVSDVDYRDMMRDAQDRAKDCVKNDTPHPSPEACQNGFPKNVHPIESNTGHATPVQSNSLGGNGSVNPSDCDVPIPKTNAAAPDAASSVDPVSSSVNKGINF